MFITTTENIHDKKISKNMFSDIGAGFKTMVGGELKAYTNMQQDARNKATERMVEQATK